MSDYSQYDDQTLFTLLSKKSDESAFTEIYNRYWEKLFFVAHKRVQSADDAKEIVQSVFLVLWEKRTTLNIQSLNLYLAAMIRYAVYRHWSNEKRRDSHLKLVHDDSKKIISEFDLDNKQLLDLLVKFADTLPEKYKVVFISHKLLDRPLEEVAQQLGVSIRTAEGYVSKVMEIMRNQRKQIAFSFLI